MRIQNTVPGNINTDLQDLKKWFDSGKCFIFKAGKRNIFSSNYFILTESGDRSRLGPEAPLHHGGQLFPSVCTSNPSEVFLLCFLFSKKPAYSTRYVYITNGQWGLEKGGTEQNKILFYVNRNIPEPLA